MKFKFKLTNQDKENFMLQWKGIIPDEAVSHKCAYTKLDHSWRLAKMQIQLTWWDFEIPLSELCR